MTKIIKVGYLILFFGIITSSCKKDADVSKNKIVPAPISLEVHAVHHSWDVPGINVYLKKNATEFPGKDSSLYEYQGKTDGYGKYTFEHLYLGNYYLYATGFDSLWGANVTSSFPINLNSNNVADNYSALTIYVSE